MVTNHAHFSERIRFCPLRGKSWVCSMAKDENVKRRRKKRERQDWDPHWSIKTLYTLGSAALSALKIAIGGCLTVVLILLICGVVFVY